MHASWTCPPSDLTLSAGSVDVWRIPLRELILSDFYGLLSPEEAARAKRFASVKKTREFVICRGALRRILAVALDEDPRAFSFEYEDRGRPYLAEGGRFPGINFSVSHSHDLALIAVARERQVGVDIELVRADVDHENLSRRFFSSAEYQALQDCNKHIRLRAFFAVWTRKEALVKATGKGIAWGLKQFDVSADPDQPARLLATRWEGDSYKDWSLTNIGTAPDYLACLAVGGNSSIRYWDMTPV